MVICFVHSPRTAAAHKRLSNTNKQTDYRNSWCWWNYSELLPRPTRETHSKASPWTPSRIFSLRWDMQDSSLVSNNHPPICCSVLLSLISEETYPRVRYVKTMNTGHSFSFNAKINVQTRYLLYRIEWILSAWRGIIFVTRWKLFLVLVAITKASMWYSLDMEPGWNVEKKARAQQEWVV